MQRQHIADVTIRSAATARCGNARDEPKAGTAPTADTLRRGLEPNGRRPPHTQEPSAPEAGPITLDLEGKNRSAGHQQHAIAPPWARRLSGRRLRPFHDPLPCVLATCLSVHPAFAESAPKDAALPGPIMTSGAIDTAVTLSDICNGTTKNRRPRTTAVCDQVFAAYSIQPADRYHYECDHSVPVALGGNSAAAHLSFVVEGCKLVSQIGGGLGTTT